ncbi:MAG: RNA polymerase sigma-70 factor [Tannerella sp.]|jgi:RNA polymerase sigma-70 factor (ECF subfamily)|nr:RNA polymerase sigma-70 factor [Tannerella sp.]
MPDEYDLIAALKEGNAQAFSLIFNAWYRDLVLFAGNCLAQQAACEDIVQSVFLKLWSERATLVIDTSLKSWLLRAVRNACLDEIRHRNVVFEHESYVLSSLRPDDLVDTENYVLYSELQRHLHRALERMPEAYREAFELNRFEGLKYREIAGKLNVSERTVEDRIGKAISFLRKYLREFLVMAGWLVLRYGLW